ncbi:C39 family peptidase [Neobacillus niacini]|uniref:C39 family peptidase n=1 Tax=Neobacillus niacini TaxID=86668 RepID=UPI0007AB7F7C|nr:C39 family peptidase [Neobacillus niacini]MEC1522149.1 C39 family peptidase [Neobacillus niacini]
MKRVVIYGFSLIVLCFSIVADVGSGSNEEEAKATPFTKVVLAEEIQLDVPLLNQMDEPRLFNGCEVTSLAMLLQYWGINVTKNQLAEQIPRVPLQYGDGKNGNPNMGFAGNMEDGPGLGVYHGPIFYLANTHIPNDLMVQNLSNYPFSSILEKVSQGLPVWVITTTDFAPIQSFQTWSTPQGSVRVSFNMHSVVITGYDQNHIYLNDPYGTKNKQVNREKFIAAWEQMGSQAIVIAPK